MSTNRSETVGHGLVVGVVGYVTIALAVSAGDLLQGRNFFYTVALLGQWMFYGLTDPAELRIWPGVVLAYNGLHLVTFLAFGLLASWLASLAERGPLYWYSSLVMFLFVFVHMFATVLLMTEPLRQAIPMWQIILPSTFAVAAMSAYLLRTHPQLRHDMDTWTDPDDEVATEPPASVRR